MLITAALLSRVGWERNLRKAQKAQTTFLEVEFGKGDLNSKEGRHKVADVFTKESRDHFDVDRIHTWVRNHKSNHSRRGGGSGGNGWFSN